MLPFKIWGNAATRISALWDSKTIDYQEKGKGYPLFAFYLNYLINFIFDALMFLAWPVGLIAAIVLGILSGEIVGFGSALVGFYSLVLGLRLAKEILFFILNTLITWILDVIKNIGQLIKNIWLLNFVIKKKGNWVNYFGFNFNYVFIYTKHLEISGPNLSSIPSKSNARNDR